MSSDFKKRRIKVEEKALDVIGLKKKREKRNLRKGFLYAKKKNIFCLKKTVSSSNGFASSRVRDREREKLPPAIGARLDLWGRTTSLQRR